jgi:hypothetical protein
MPPVVKFRRAGAFVPGNLLRQLQLAAVFQIRRNPRSPECVIADPRFDLGRFGPALDHAVSVLLPQEIFRQNTGASLEGPEERPVGVAGNAGRRDVLIQESLQVVMTGDGMFPTAFLMQPYPATKRPALQRCLKALEHGDILIVWKLDRLGRSLRDLIALLDDLKQRGVKFQSLTESIDTATPTGRGMWQMIGVLAELERSLITESTRAGVKAAQRRGVKFGRKRYQNNRSLTRGP